MDRRIPDLTRIEETIGWQPERKLDEIISDVIDFTKSSVRSRSELKSDHLATRLRWFHASVEARG